VIYSQQIQNQPIPTAVKVGKEYLIQNTVKFAKDNNLFKTDIDLHPSKYIILNDASTVAPGPIYDKDSGAYYDPTQPQKQRPQPRDFSIPQSRYTSNIYPLDQKPYYGPNDFKEFSNVADDRVQVKVEMGNLTERVPTRKNIQTLTNQLTAIKNQYEGPKFLSQETRGKEVYYKDIKPYYDPSAQSKKEKIVSLTNTIKTLSKKLNDNSARPQFGKVSITNHVQNFVNKNKENTNKFIADSYYYDVDPSTIQGNRKPDIQIRIGSTDKYYDRTPEQTLVEADSVEKGNLKKK